MKRKGENHIEVHNANAFAVDAVTMASTGTCVAGWFTFALCSDKPWKSFEASNICGAFCGISLFYGIKNGLGGLSDILSSLTGKYVNGYPHPIVPLVNAFVAVPRILVGCFFLTMAGELIGLIPAQEERKNNKTAPTLQKRKTDEQDISRLIEQTANIFNLLPAEPDQPNYHGYKLVDRDNGGTPDPLWRTVDPQDVQLARSQSRLYGNPGGGLSQSNFTANEIQSGQKGEQVLASMIAANCPNVVSFWSLHGLDERHRFTDADIDCVIAGQDKQGRTHLWFVDAKNYKGNADTAYRNISQNQLVRISVSQRAFETGMDGRPDLELSANVGW